MKNNLYKMRMGKKLNIKNTDYTVVGMIEFIQGTYKWREYRLIDEQKEEYWLSISQNETEVYSLFRQLQQPFDTEIAIYQGRRFIEIEAGTASVYKTRGRVDVSPNEEVSFIDYECKPYQQFLGIEKWEDGTQEYSFGELLEPSDFRQTYEQEEDKEDVGEEREEENYRYSAEVMFHLKIGQKVRLHGNDYEVEDFAKMAQGDFYWMEYHLKHTSSAKEYWLIVEPDNSHYLVSLFKTVALHTVKRTSDSTSLIYNDTSYKKIESGMARVANFSGTLEYDIDEIFRFIDYESSQGQVLSSERWSDGSREYSVGGPLLPNDFQLIKSKQLVKQNQNKNKFISNRNSETFRYNELFSNKKLLIFLIVLGCLSFFIFDPFISKFINNLTFFSPSIENVIKKENIYPEVTAVTFNDKRGTHSRIYESKKSVDDTCQELIKLQPNQIKYVTTVKDDIEHGEKMIQTKKETLLIYESELESTFIQIFPNKDYRRGYASFGSRRTRRLRDFYERNREWEETTKSKDIPVQGEIDTTHYDSHVSSARQTSVNSRNRLGGGTGYGK